MILKDIDKQLEKLYRTYENYNGTVIATGISYEGNPVNFLFNEEDDKYSCISTSNNFSEWMAWRTNGWIKASARIEKIAIVYGVHWDNEKGSLYIRFRRNEMSLAEAVIRLQQAVAVVGSIGEE